MCYIYTHWLDIDTTERTGMVLVHVQTLMSENVYKYLYVALYGFCDLVVSIYFDMNVCFSTSM